MGRRRRVLAGAAARRSRDRAGRKRGSHALAFITRCSPSATAQSHSPTMPAVLPTIEQIEDYLKSVEELVVSSLSAATPDLPRVSEAIHRLWQDVLRHSPQAVPATLKGLGAFEVPPPPPPPPPPKSFFEDAADWVADHPWTIAGLGVSVLGAGLLVGYASPRLRHKTRVGGRKHATAVANTERRQVIGECVSSHLMREAGRPWHPRSRSRIRPIASLLIHTPMKLCRLPYPSSMTYIVSYAACLPFSFSSCTWRRLSSRSSPDPRSGEERLHRHN